MSQPSAGIARARELIDEIFKENGFVRERTLKTLSREARFEVEQALAKDNKLASSVLAYVPVGRRVTYHSANVVQSRKESLHEQCALHLRAHTERGWKPI